MSILEADIANVDAAFGRENFDWRDICSAFAVNSCLYETKVTLKFQLPPQKSHRYKTLPPLYSISP